ncbi:hypothetical protein SDC9_35828 [bioreactor metagenome]|uniref:Uncharacterized protein n=1 Tax=bioreactor metagenome TaxID=1076179 RepID=A0A644VEM2_9ZZZZ
MVVGVVIACLPFPARSGGRILPGAVVAQHRFGRRLLRPFGDEGVVGFGARQPGLAPGRAQGVGLGRIGQSSAGIDRDGVDVLRRRGGTAPHRHVARHRLGVALQHVAIARPARDRHIEGVAALEQRRRMGKVEVVALPLLGGAGVKLGHGAGQGHAFGHQRIEVRSAHRLHEGRRRRPPAEDAERGREMRAEPHRAERHHRHAVHLDPHADAGTAAVFPVTIGIVEEIPEGIEEGTLGLGGLDIAAIAHRGEEGAGNIDAIHAGASARTGGVDLGGDVGHRLAPLVEAAEDRHRKAGVPGPGRARGVGGIGELRPGHEHALAEGHHRGGGIGHRHVAVGIDEAVFRELPVHRLEQAVVGGQVGHQPAADIDHRHPQQALEIGVHRPVVQHRRGAVQDQLDPVALLLDRQVDLQQRRFRPGRVHEAGLAIDAVIERGDARARRLAGLLQDPAQPADEEIRADLGQIVVQAPLGDARGGKARLDVEHHGARIAGRGRQKTQKILLQREVLADLDRRAHQPLVVARLRPIHHAAGLRSAAFAGVDRRADEADQFAAGEDRDAQAHVGIVHAAIEGVVVEEGVAFLQAHGRVMGQMLDEVFHRQLAQHRVVIDAGGADRQIALCGIDAEGHVAPPHRGRRAQLHRGFLALERDHVQLVGEDLVFQIVQPLHRPCLAGGGRFRAQPLHDLGVAAVADGHRCVHSVLPWTGDPVTGPPPCCAVSALRGDDAVAQAVHAVDPARLDHIGRVGRLDDRGTGDLGAGAQRGPVVDRGVDHALGRVEAGRSDRTGFGVMRALVAAVQPARLLADGGGDEDRLDCDPARGEGRLRRIDRGILRLEPVAQGAEVIRPGKAQRRRGHPRQVVLRAIAHVEFKREGDAVGVEALELEIAGGAVGQIGDHRVQRRRIGQIGLVHEIEQPQAARLLPDLADLHRRGAEGARDRGHRRHDDRGGTDMAREAAGMARARAAAGIDREPARVVALERDLVEHLLPHAGVDQAADAPGGLEHRDPQRLGDAAADRLMRGIGIKQHGAAEVIVRVHVAKHQIGVGHRRFLPALIVARRARHRARRLRPDLELTAHGLIDPGDRAAARADRAHLDRRDIGAPAVDDRNEVLCPQHAPGEHADIEGGAPHVGEDDVLHAFLRADQRGAIHPRHRPRVVGQHGPGARHLLRTAGVVHEDQRPAIVRPAQVVGQIAQFLHHHAVDVGVDQRRHRAGVFARLGRDLGGQRDRHRAEEFLGIFLLDDAADLALMRGVHERPQQADDDALHAAVDQRLQLLAQLVGVEGADHPAVAVKPLGQAHHHVGGDQRLGLADHRHVADLVEGHAVGPAARAADEDRVLEARGGDQPEARPLALDQRVGADRGGIAQRLDLAEEAVRRQTGALAELAQAADQADRQVVMGGGRFGGDQRAIFGDGAQIGKGAADVDANIVSHGFLPDRSGASGALRYGCDGRAGQLRFGVMGKARAAADDQRQAGSGRGGARALQGGAEAGCVRPVRCDGQRPRARHRSGLRRVRNRGEGQVRLRRAGHLGQGRPHALQDVEMLGQTFQRAIEARQAAVCGLLAARRRFAQHDDVGAQPRQRLELLDQPRLDLAQRRVQIAAKGPGAGDRAGDLGQHREFQPPRRGRGPGHRIAMRGGRQGDAGGGGKADPDRIRPEEPRRRHRGAGQRLRIGEIGERPCLEPCAEGGGRGHQDRRTPVQPAAQGLDGTKAAHAAPPCFAFSASMSSSMSWVSGWPGGRYSFSSTVAQDGQ